MTNRQRAAHHLNMATQETMFEATARLLQIPRSDASIEKIRWHLFQARFARLIDVMPVDEAFWDADKWAN